jgi:hypothetical protein
MVSGLPAPLEGEEWGLLLRQKLDGNALITIDAFHKKLGRAPTYGEMKDELINRFDHVCLGCQIRQI